jgi:transposase
VLRLRDAAAWYEAGKHDLVGGQTETAVTALRRAASIIAITGRTGLPWRQPSAPITRTTRLGRCC